MTNPPKRNASGKGGDRTTKLAGEVGVLRKAVRCGTKDITRLRHRLHTAGLLLGSTRTDTQIETLLKTLVHLGETGINTPQAVGVGYARVATRVFDLEQQGWRIDTVREDVITADGLKHKGIARYILRGRRDDLPNPQGSLDLGDAP
jgi:hypothetical protein